ncbi:hypothetical protein [Clavibacter sp.]|uniref:hypothetical protein n=1 Tax=Clavibacter sp. TaxID=1871044 RepID=UPI0019AE89EF|nr:hypothetical protein [Clavibacter sp.]MBD5382009.1 hypothetical protein [Clavibacter sp.]
MSTPEEIKKIARQIAEKLTAGDDYYLHEEIRNVEKALKVLVNDYEIIGKDFIKRQRLIIEFDKKQMLEKPIGEKIALAGVYQAKLELMDKLFGSLFEEEK